MLGTREVHVGKDDHSCGNESKSWSIRIKDDMPQSTGKKKEARGLGQGEE